MEEITLAAFFTFLLLILTVVLYRTFVARKNSRNTNAQPIHQKEVTTEHQLIGSPSQVSLLGSTGRTTSSTVFQGTSSSSSSSSSSIHPCKYEVFLSFRGKDTRHNFTAHLHQALFQKGITTFIDDEELRSGEEISSALIKAIEESKISIVILSEAYASSKWCLDELLKIVETKGQKVIPVFYKVDPLDVRYQKNNYEKALAKHAERLNDDEKVEKWKAALTQVANLSGWHLENCRNEAEFIYKIVQNVIAIVNHTYLHVAKHPVGIESRVHEINSLLSIEKNDHIRVVGILGAGGIGKTTIAKDIYNLIASQFEVSCFLSNVRETSKQYSGMVQLQNTLLSKILGRQDVKVDSVDEGITVIKRRFCSRKVLLILDDVDDKLDQLDKLAGEVNWFGLGSRIIITTRDMKVLTNHGVVDHLIYRVRELDRKESLELFCWNAFQVGKPTDGFLKLMEDAISYAGGLPLALEVLGSHLYGEDICEWRRVLDKYNRIPLEKIQKRLEISYNGLNRDEKNIFLDIACFFKGKLEDYVKPILANCFPKTSIRVLIQKSLITIDNCGRLAMHDLLQDMGREVVQQESPYPGERSRLWFHEDICEVLENDMGTNKIQGILVDLPEGEDMVHLSSKAFENMRSLRLLMVTPNARFSTGPNFLSNKLRVLEWPNCPLESLPSNFRGKNLIVLRMDGSLLKDYKEIKNFQSMRMLNFSGCEFLKIFPDVSRISNLEDLRLDCCKNLVEVHHSVGFLDKLVFLSLDQCYNLGSFPRSLKLRSLKYLCVTCCSRLNYFPEIECEMECLECVIFQDTGIKELPSSISYLIGLKYLSLYDNINLMHLPLPPPTNSSVSNDDCSSIVFPALQELYVHNCVLSESSFFRIFNCSPTLIQLDLSGSAIVTIPPCIERFIRLSKLKLDNCKQLRKILRLPPNIKEVSATGCMSLETFFEEPRTSQLFNTWWLPELVSCWARGHVGSDAPSTTYQNVQTMAIAQPLEGLYKHRSFKCVVSGNKIPDWFNYHKKVSNSKSCEIDIDEAADMFGEFTIIAFSAVVVRIYECCVNAYVISRDVELFRVSPVWRSASDIVWLHFRVPQYSFKLPSVDHVRVKFEVMGGEAYFESCGFHLVHLCNKNANDLIDGIQLKKGLRDDGDGNLESNWRSQQKRHSSTLGIRFSNAEDTPPGDQSCEAKAKDSIGGLHEVTKRPRDDDDDNDDNFEANC